MQGSHCHDAVCIYFRRQLLDTEKIIFYTDDLATNQVCLHLSAGALITELHYHTQANAHGCRARSIWLNYRQKQQEYTEMVLLQDLSTSCTT